LFRKHPLTVVDTDAELASQVTITVRALANRALSVLAHVRVQVFRIRFAPRVDAIDVFLRILGVPLCAGGEIAFLAVRAISVSHTRSSVEVTEWFRDSAYFAALHNRSV
jgi:hypothetical protein